MTKVSRPRAAVARPDREALGWLIHGDFPAEADDLRARLTAALVEAAGPGSELTRLDPGEVRHDPAALADALRAGSLFGGAPVVLVEGAGDGLAPAIRAALEGLAPGGGVLVATSGRLGGGSALRKLFEGDPALRSLAIYGDPLGRAEIEALVRESGAPGADPAALDLLDSLAKGMEPAELRGLIRTLGLYVMDTPRPLAVEDVDALRPGAEQGDVDAVVDAVAARRGRQAVKAYARALARGVSPGKVAMDLGRRLRQLHALATHPAGPRAALGRLYLPYAVKDRVLAQSRDWPVPALESALEQVLDAELSLRSTGGPPDAAAVERLVIRLAMTRVR